MHRPALKGKAGDIKLIKTHGFSTLPPQPHTRQRPLHAHTSQRPLRAHAHAGTNTSDKLVGVLVTAVNTVGTVKRSVGLHQHVGRDPSTPLQGVYVLGNQEGRRKGMKEERKCERGRQEGG